MAHEKDPQLERLNAQLRDRGCPPGHDLWTGIDAAITVEEKRLFKGTKDEKVSFLRPRILWLAAAVATFALILVPLNFQPNGHDQVAENRQQEFKDKIALVQSEKTLQVAMNNLEMAVLENPDDPNLLRLVRMVNSRQGELLRYKYAENTRVQDLLNGEVI